MKYYSRERILLAGTKYNSRGPNITRGDHILLAGTIYYSREWNITRGDVLITRGAEKLLAGTKYYSREYNITRGNELLLAEKNITRGKELLLAGIYLLLAGTIYYSRERNIGSIWHQRASVVVSCVCSDKAWGPLATVNVDSIILPHCKSPPVCEMETIENLWSYLFCKGVQMTIVADYLDNAGFSTTAKN